MIRNTTADMNNPSHPDALLLLADGMATGSPSRFIEAQEKAGQQQLVHSDRLPTEARDGDAHFEALGFTFGAPDPADPMFRPATLPDGWVKQASDHDMWSYVVDPLGRRRVAIFYKAAFYDRSAFMRLVSIYEVVHDHGYDGTPIVPDDEWATPEAIADEARKAIGQCDEYIAMYKGDRYQGDRDEWAKKRIAEHTEQRARYEALVVRFGAKGGAA